MKSLTQSISKEINDEMPTPRLRARRNDMVARDVRDTLLAAIRFGHAYHASHGGSVPNSYGYPAETECAGLIVLREGSDSAGALHYNCGGGRAPANKVTQAAALRATVISGFGPWWTLAAGRTPAVELTKPGQRMARYRVNPAMRTTAIHSKGMGGEVVHTLTAAAVLARAAIRKLASRRKLGWKVGFEKHQGKMLSFARRSDGEAYHFEAAALKTAKAIVAMAEEIVKAFAARDAAKAQAAAQVRQSAMILADIATTRVALDDSRRAGNCIEGSLQFAETKLGLSRADCLAAGYLLRVPAKRILAVANGQTDRAMGAITAAWLRETTVSI